MKGGEFMTKVKLFQAEGGKVRGLKLIAEGTLGAVPKVGDCINMAEPADALAYKIEAVVFLLNEDAVRLIVSSLAV
jgi:hypothetical protein